MKKQEFPRHKAVMILISFAGNEPHFLVVRDRKFQDWTFVTGGCRRREIMTPLLCAIRELKEETKGVVNLSRGKYNCYNFTTKVDSKNIILNFRYHAYITEVDISLEEQQKQISKYQEEMLNPTHPKNRFYNETDGLLWVTLEELKIIKLWDVMKQYVLENPEFIALLTSSNRTKFNVSPL